MNCLCGHPETMHEHYHSGSYCGRCGRGGCPYYRRPSLLRRLFGGGAR